MRSNENNNLKENNELSFDDMSNLLQSFGSLDDHVEVSDNDNSGTNDNTEEDADNTKEGIDNTEEDVENNSSSEFEGFTLDDISMPDAASYPPCKIVKELDKYIIGQTDAKRAVAIALRNRWRRAKVQTWIKDEITPKNILMIGPTGVGKTEVARRLAKISGAPFLKVEATKFTEVGYVGRDVDSIVRDLMEAAVNLVRGEMNNYVKGKAHNVAIEKVLDIISGEKSSEDTRRLFRKKLLSGKMDESFIYIEVLEKPKDVSMPSFDLPGNTGQVGMVSMGDMFSKILGNKKKKRKKVKVKDAIEIIAKEESDKMIDHDLLTKKALSVTESHGIVFIDEIDKITARSDSSRDSVVTREGVQRDLLPLIEGTTVTTKYGTVNTEHILFIASGAFHIAKPSDLLPELQGRLPIRVELQSLSKSDLVKILTDTRASLIKQYTALFEAEGVKLEFKDDAIEEVAIISSKINTNIENIGARRLNTVMEKVLEEISFDLSESNKKKIIITKKYVNEKIAKILEKEDLSRYIL